MRATPEQQNEVILAVSFHSLHPLRICVIMNTSDVAGGGGTSKGRHF